VCWRGQWQGLSPIWRILVRAYLNRCAAYRGEDPQGTLDIADGVRNWSRAYCLSLATVPVGDTLDPTDADAVAAHHAPHTFMPVCGGRPPRLISDVFSSRPARPRHAEKNQF